MLDEKIANKINETMEKGYEARREDKDKLACKYWGELWDYIKLVYESGNYNCINKLDEDYNAYNNIHENKYSDECIYNWSGDYENALSVVGETDKAYYQKRIDFLTKYIEIFTIDEYPPEGCSEFEYKNDYYNFLEQLEYDKSYVLDLKKAIAESYIKVGNKEKGQELIKECIEEYPKNEKKLKKWANKYQLTV